MPSDTDLLCFTLLTVEKPERGEIQETVMNENVSRISGSVEEFRWNSLNHLPRVILTLC